MKQLENLLQKMEEMFKDKDKYEFDYGWSFRNYNFSTGQFYIGIFNNIVLNLSAIKNGYKLPYWTGFKQAMKNKININKGAKGTPLIICSKKTEYYLSGQLIENNDIDDSMLPDVTIKERRFYQPAYVFNIEQTDANPENYLMPTSPQMDSLDVLLHNYCKRENINIYDTLDMSFYDFVKDAIFIPNKLLFYDMETYFETFAHECAHSTGAKNRLNRTQISYKKSQEDKEKEKIYDTEELIAELTSAILLSEFGIDHLENSIAYLSSYLKEASIKELWNLSSLAQKAVDYIKNPKEVKCE